MRHTSAEDTAMDLVIEDDSRVETVYFLMSEDNIRKQIVLPWLSFASDADAEGIDGVFQKFSAHPRTFGNFARVYARYVRDEGLLSVEEAVRKMTALPASNLGIERRGSEQTVVAHHGMRFVVFVGPDHGITGLDRHGHRREHEILYQEFRHGRCSSLTETGEGE